MPVAEVMQSLRQTELPQLVYRGFCEHVGHSVNARTSHSTIPVTASRRPDRVHVHPAPLVGQHNHDLLSGLGLTDDEIAEPAAQRVVGTGLAMHGTSKV